ncbi:MAG: RNase adapter RapZ [Deltaproteobacteria bacterium]|nr:RNase adapter RapZ [Deltaproteobacteria bacterium]
MDNIKITIVSGLSGSGKSTAIAMFEDAGFYCVDNMPVALLPKFMELPFDISKGFAGFAFGMDLREKDFSLKYPSVFDSLKDKGYYLDILFFEADEEILIRRFSQTRRHHPLSDGKGILEGIRSEKIQLESLRQISNKIIDTSKTNVHELKSMLAGYIQEAGNRESMHINIISFGFKNGLPRDADLVADVRLLENPYFVPELTLLDGETDKVRNYVLSNEVSQVFIKKYIDLLDYLIPLYKKEGKSHLTIAFGCTGGRHRSVVVACTVFEHIAKQYKQVEIIHRDKDE